MNYLCKDTLKIIFQLLQAKDLILCSMVCKSWNRVSKDENIWRKLLKQECDKLGRKLFGRIAPEQNYKSMYIQLFDQRYHSQFLTIYSEIWYGLTMKSDIRHKIFIFLICLIPLCFFMLPFVVFIDAKDYWTHRSRSYKVCKCKSCEERICRWINK
jgi:hypothetical protein